MCSPSSSRGTAGKQIPEFSPQATAEPRRARAGLAAFTILCEIQHYANILAHKPPNVNMKYWGYATTQIDLKPSTMSSRSRAS
jgi:hypothetical protein